jgi:hypothetical protein
LSDRGGSVAGDELLVDVVDEERLTLLLADRARLESERGMHGPPVCGGPDDAVVEHRLQHLMKPFERRLRVPERVEQCRGLGQPRQQRCLQQRQAPRRRRKVRLRCGLDPVRLLAVEHGVEIGREDALLRPAACELVGEATLLELA